MNSAIERSIIKTYRKEIWARFVKGVKDFNMIQDGDKIAVCISGGKDSFLLAKCMQELKRHGKIDFEIVFLCMNPGYADKNLELIKSNAELMNMPLHIFETDIFMLCYNAINEFYQTSQTIISYIAKLINELTPQRQVILIYISLATSCVLFIVLFFL